MKSEVMPPNKGDFVLAFVVLVATAGTGTFGVTCP
jgi:hypothetical protein